MTNGTDELLQRLPIPNLQDTLQKYYERIKPLQDSKQNEKFHERLFSPENLKSLNLLNDELISYERLLAKENPKSSYIEQFWFDAYLLYDQSIVMNSNPFFQLADDPTINNLQINNNLSYGSFTLQIKRTTKLIISILKFIKEIRQNSLKPDLIKGKTKLSMDQYEKLFGSSRLPAQNFNNSNSCNLQTDKTSHHIIIMYKSNFYWFDVLDINNNPIFQKPEDLEWNLYSIIMDFDNSMQSQQQTPSIGVFTTESRKVWSNIRDYIFNDEDKSNYQNLKLIDSALFIICLDDIAIENENELVKSMLCGTSNINLNNIKGENNKNNNIKKEMNLPKNSLQLVLGLQTGTCLNRWYDKLQLIVTRNGKAGINFEHTGVDGHTILRLVTDIYTDSILSFANTITKNVPKIFNDIDWETEDDNESKLNNCKKNVNLITIPRKLEWKIDSFLSSSLHFAETRLSDLISQYDLETLNFEIYGSSHIKSQFSCSPDAFTQQIFQIAYYALYGKFENTYEPAMTKVFQNGRTEAIRSVTTQSKKFVKSLFDGNANDRDRINSLQEACKEHSRITRECAMGLGQDRHLYALYCLYNEKFKDNLPLPSIFSDKAWDILNTNVLSTSNCGNPCLKNFGFGPVTANGFGIGYVIRDNSISIVVSSRHRQTKRFVSLIEKSFLEVDHIFQRVYTPSDGTSGQGKSIDSNANDQYLVGLRNFVKKQDVKSKDLRYLLGGYDYFDVSISG